ncbi:MAG: hypothetical protein HWD60_01400 [Defluviicoccus sp.]|nr:MAG: hypothetical protein HWD60_01400 [Defluviicoccus sp.]
MDIVASFSYLKKQLPISADNGQLSITMSYDEFMTVVKLLLRGVTVDEAWYLERYPDVADAVKAGVFKSARSHFIESGYFEDRWPAEPCVDESWYLENNEDVAEGVKSGTIKDALSHFVEHGYQEGRAPTPY